MGWSAGLAVLLVGGFLDWEVAHFAFDDAGIGAVAALGDDLAQHFAEQVPIVIFMSGQGEKIPVSRCGTG